MTIESSGYYTFVNPQGDVAPWSTANASYRAPQNAKTRKAAPSTPATTSTPRQSVKSEPVYVEAHVVGEHPQSGSRIAGVAQTVAGVGLMAIGVPMLIFPGPGVAAIAGGAALAGSGVRKIFRGR